jgi:hypothetical protein
VKGGYAPNDSPMTENFNIDRKGVLGQREFFNGGSSDQNNENDLPVMIEY